MNYVEKLSQLTIQEKCWLCCCSDCINFPGVPRLNIPPMKGADGPQGLRMEDERNASALPCTMALAASFDTELAEKYGEVLAEECVANGFQIIFGPGVNLMRTPLNGRNFEYMGEDPLLAGKIAAAYVRGCQSKGVAACPKHLALNNQEICRTNGSSNCDWETIRNLYLEAFRIIVKEASPWCIMSSYNKVNGEFASQCGTLQQQILKDEWGFDGVVISDAGAVHDGRACFLNGLDASLADLFYKEIMPGLVENGELPIEILDEKARRLLMLTERTGGVKETPYDQAEHAGFCRKSAAVSMCLLKNKDNILPLDPARHKKILITGPSAATFNCIGSLERQGGSGAVHPPYEITPLAGLKANLNDFELTYIPCLRNRQNQYLDSGMVEMSIRYFDYKSGELFYEEKTSSSTLSYGKINAGGAVEAHPASNRTFRAEITGKLKASAPMHGQFAFFDSRLKAELYYNGNEIKSGDENIPFTMLKAGEILDFTMKFEFNYIRYVELNLLWIEDDQAEKSRLLEAAPGYDAVIYFGGRTHLQDKEAIGSRDVPGADIATWELPDGQDGFLHDLCSVNSNVIGVFNAGSPFDMRSWHENIGAILISWYPGMEGGNAIADVLTGKVEPSGRLPFTWGKDIMDYACHANGSYPGVRGNGDDAHTDYLEGELIGYRYFDRSGTIPYYPFGGGMGYSEFEFAGTEVCRKDGMKITVSVKNCGSRDSSEVIQLYAGGRKNPENKPLKELKSFRKIIAAPGETVEVEFVLSNADIEELKAKAFTEVLVGRNAAELPVILPF